MPVMLRMATATSFRAIPSSRVPIIRRALLVKQAAGRHGDDPRRDHEERREQLLRRLRLSAENILEGRGLERP